MDEFPSHTTTVQRPLAADDARIRATLRLIVWTLLRRIGR